MEHEYTEIDVEFFREDIERIVDECHSKGIRFVITENGETVCYLIPYKEFEELSEKAWMYDGLE